LESVRHIVGADFVVKGNLKRDIFVLQGTQQIPIKFSDVQKLSLAPVWATPTAEVNRILQAHAASGKLSLQKRGGEGNVLPVTNQGDETAAFSPSSHRAQGGEI